MQKKYRILPAVIVFFSVSLLAAAAYPEVLTLDAAVKAALENNRSYNATQKDTEAAVWGQAQSISNYLPKVFFDNSYTRLDPDSVHRAKQAADAQAAIFKKLAASLNQPAPSSSSQTQVFENTYQSSIQVTQPIFNGGKEIVGIYTATVQKRDKRYGEQDTRASTVNQAKQAYFSAQKASSLVKTSQEALELARQTLKLTQARYDVGQLSRAEVLRWESQAAGAEGDQIAATNSLRLAHMNLNVIMGVELEKTWDFPDIDISAQAAEVAAKTIPIEVPVPDFSLISDHPAIRQMRENVHLSEASRDLAITQVLPQANFIFNYGWQANDTMALDGNKEWTATVSLNIPIFQSLSGAFGITSAQKTVVATRLREDDFRRLFLQRSYNANLNMQAAVQRVIAALKAVKFAQENLDIVKTRQQIGAASNLDLLDAENTYIQAKSSMVSATADYYIAAAEYEYVSAK